MIQAQGLTRYYGDFCAVDRIDFEIPGGEILGLLGPNGAGKTTVLRMLTGYLKPTSGTIQVRGLDVEKDGLEIKRHMGYLPESAPLYQDMLAYDYLYYIAGIHQLSGDARTTRIKELADLCGLREVLHKSINELSKGYKQRVGLAHAMMSDPEILVLDEPTSGLDPNQIIEIREIIRRIGRKKTVVLSTHILNEAEATCDHILIINRGRIVADGSAETLKQSAGGETHIKLLLEGAVMQAVKDTLASIEGVQDILSIEERDGLLGIRLICSHGQDPRGRIYERIKQTDWILLEFHQETKSLEHIFQALTQEN